MAARGPRRERSARGVACVLALQAVLFSAVVRAEPQEPPWEFSLTPYLWLPHVDAAMRYETPGSGGSPVSVTNLLQHLNAALFLNGEARKGRWGLATDFVYCSFQKEGSNVSNVSGPGGESEVPVNSGTTTTLTGYMVSLTGNYAVVRRHRRCARRCRVRRREVVRPVLPGCRYRNVEIHLAGDARRRLLVRLG